MPHGTSAGRRSDFRTLRESQGIFDIDAEISNGALDLRVAEQDLNGTQVVSPLVDQRCFRPAK